MLVAPTGVVCIHFLVTLLARSPRDGTAIARCSFLTRVWSVAHTRAAQFLSIQSRGNDCSLSFPAAGRQDSISGIGFRVLASRRTNLTRASGARSPIAEWHGQLHNLSQAFCRTAHLQMSGMSYRDRHAHRGTPRAPRHLWP